MRVWDKGGADPDQEILGFTTGEDPILDNHLIPYDIVGTVAHVRGLEKIGVLTPGESAALVEALRALYRDWEGGKFRLSPVDEDVHSAIERALTEHLGAVGRKVHTGRSRNDQVLTAIRLLLKELTLNAMRRLGRLAWVTAEAARGKDRVIMPGYSHGQRAMPVTLAFWYASFAEAWADHLDAGRSLYHRIDASPLGAAAGFGVPLPLDRAFTADLLGFGRVQMNAAAVQNSRGRSEAALLHWLVEIGRDVEKMSADLLLFLTAEYGFARLDEAFCTGSSIMPQKRNPDVLELLRATPSVILACREEVETIIGKLPSNYHRDYQLTKAPLLRGTEKGLTMLVVLARVLPGLTWDEARMRDACSRDMFATHRAMTLVQGGVPFREAYRQAADELAAGRTEEWLLGVGAVLSSAHAGAPGNPGLTEARKRIDDAARWTDETAKTLHDRWSALLQGTTVGK